MRTTKDASLAGRQARISAFKCWAPSTPQPPAGRRPCTQHFALTRFTHTEITPHSVEPTLTEPTADLSTHGRAP